MAELTIGQLWRHQGDESYGVVREIRLDRWDDRYVYGTGAQSGRSTRVLRDVRTGGPQGYRLVEGGGAR